jgi:hypothetical protein
MKKIQMEKKVSVGILIYQGTPTKLLEPKTIEIRFSLRTENDDLDNILESQINHNISYAKIRLFLDSILPNTLICGAHDLEECLQLSSELENNIMVLPDCGESMVAAALHHKLNAICKDLTFMDEIVLYEPEQDITFRYLMTDDELDVSLPTGGWLGELSFWDDPWWDRDDVLTFDNVARTKKELKTFSDQKIIHDYNSRETFTNLENEIAKMFEPEEAVEDKPAQDADVIRVDFNKG